MSRRDCKHEECPYKYCRHHKYWNGTEYNKLNWTQKIIIPDDEDDSTVDMCMSYLDV